MAKKVSHATESSLRNNEDNIYRLVWFNKNLKDQSNKQKLDKLRDIDEKIESFACEEQCVDYMQTQDEDQTISYIIFIISDPFNEEIIPLVHDCKILLAIFIFSTNSDNFQHLKFPKLRAICTDINGLLDRIRHCMERDKVSIDFSLFNNQNSKTTSAKEKFIEQNQYRNLKEDQARFLWFYKCHYFLIELENDDDSHAKQEMISSYRQKYEGNQRTLKAIDEFENESLDDNAQHAIGWYTRNSCIFRYMNEVLVSGNISDIYSQRYLIKLLRRQLKNLNKKYRRSNSTGTLHLYRGQRLKLSQILLISKHKNDLISFNSFISTTLEEDIAKRFCFGRPKDDDESVIFEINIDLTTNQSIDFSDISHISKYPEEEEILLSIGSIFRIESVDFDEERQLYRIHLSLNQHEQLIVNEYIEQTYPKEGDSADQSILFGKLLFDMGECRFAIEYFKNAMNHLSDNGNHNRATYLNNIGVCYNEIGEKDQALKYYKTAIRIYGQTDNHRGLGACYHNIASLYYDQGEYETALRWALQAFDKRQQYHLEQASTLDLLGCIQLAKHDAEAASHSLRKALKIRLKYLGEINSNHPDIGVSYQNLGRLDSKLSSFIDAQNNFLRAEEIFRHNYPKSHPIMIEITQCLDEIKRKLQH